jgi:monoamine oxidase
VAERREADVVVVGAGLAGLSAAWTLVQAGIETVVLEARDRVGGRVANESIGGDRIVEMGGQWMGPGQTELAALAQELGIGTFPTYDTGERLIDRDGNVRRYTGLIPPVSIFALIELGIMRWRLNATARKVSPEAPWESAHAVEWDGQTLGTWLRYRLPSRDAKAVMETAVGSIWAAEPQDLNLLQALAYTCAAGGFNALTGTTGGLQQDRFIGGSALIAERIASELAGRVVLAAPVRSVTDRAERVDVDAAGSVRVEARFAILAVPPSLAARIHFDPALPGIRDQALQRLPMGSVIKVIAVYDEPFWRGRGLSGQAVIMKGPLASTFDNSPSEGSPGVLLAFSPGARSWEFAKLSTAERRKIVIDEFVRLFGSEAARPLEYLEKDWTADPWTRGCYFGLAAPGSITGPLLTLREPVGRLHWAGSETALRFYGGMNGAVGSGQRAAQEVIHRLQSEPDLPPPPTAEPMPAV